MVHVGVREWRLNSPNLMVKSIREEREDALAYSKDGKYLAGASFSEVRLWKQDSREFPPKVLSIPWSGIGMHGVAISDDGQKLGVLSLDRKVRLWSLQNQEEEPVILSGGDVQHAISFSPDAKHLAAGSGGDKSVWLWDLEKPTRDPIALKGQRPSIHSQIWPKRKLVGLVRPR